MASRSEALVAYNKSRRFTDEEVLVAGSNYNRQLIKKRIIDGGLIEYKCQCCGLGDEWNGQSITLQLDHINGIHNDNRLENLRFLCPNCHSQTHTYGGKNSKGMRGTGEAKAKPNFKKEKALRDVALWADVKKDPDIRFGQWGWQTRCSKKLNITAQKVLEWIHRVDYQFLVDHNLLK